MLGQSGNLINVWMNGRTLVKLRTDDGRVLRLKNPDLLLCDEPTGALDISTGVIVLEALERVNRELGTTVAVITHNAAIAKLAERAINTANT